MNGFVGKHRSPLHIRSCMRWSIFNSLCDLLIKLRDDSDRDTQVKIKRKDDDESKISTSFYNELFPIVELPQTVLPCSNAGRVF